MMDVIKATFEMDLSYFIILIFFQLTLFLVSSFYEIISFFQLILYMLSIFIISFIFSLQINKFVIDIICIILCICKKDNIKKKILYGFIFLLYIIIYKQYKDFYLVLNMTFMIIINYFGFWLIANLIFSRNNLYYSEPQYIIVLGARVNGNKPSKALSQRLLKTLEYSKEKNIPIIVSGGPAHNDISESQFMKEFLCNNGIKESIVFLCLLI